MVSSKWMHSQLWCGSLPSYHLLSQDEAEQEKRISELYFDSSRFTDLRMQIRLKLKELPINSHSARSDNPAVYWDILELFDEYLPLVLSIQHYHSRHSNSKTLPYFLTTFPALFYGFGGLDLLSDRLVGKLQCAQFTIPLELVLVLCTMGQLHAIHAESQARQGGELLTVASWPTLQHAEMSWQSAESFFRWASWYSGQVKDTMESNDPVTRSIRTFFEATARDTTVLARMSSCHRLSTHITGLALREMRPERLSRIGSVFARRALTLVREANNLQSYLPESRFCQQMKWCLQAYEIRWTAIYFQCELAINRLDANPDIAIYFCNSLLKLRMPHLPSASSQQLDPLFSQFAHEIQLMHHTQLNEALDTKKSLLNEYRGRFGVFQAVNKCFGVQLLGTRDMGPVFSDEADIGHGDEETNYASPFLVEMIAANVEEALLRAEADGSPVSSVPVIMTKEPGNLSAVHQAARWGIKSVDKSLMKRCETSPNLTKAAIQTQKPSSSHPEASTDATSRVLSSKQSQKRPANATHPSSGWVTMNYGGKLLHFEKAADSPPTNQSTAELDKSNDSAKNDNSRSKPRPASSPCYLSSKRAAKATPFSSRQPDHSKAWAPTRAPCALCERRFMRVSLPGVVVMKRIYDLRRKWGVIQDSKKYTAASALYGTANVCVLCQEILLFEENSKSSMNSIIVDSVNDKDADIARMIHDSILYRWHQQPPPRAEDNNLQDIAVNKRVRQSSTVFSLKAQNALDPDTNHSAHTKEEFQPWWEIDLANYVEVHSVKVYLRDEVNHLYAAAKGLAANTPGVYPLHLSISMKTGVGRDCADIVASCVSSLCVTEKMGPPIEWLAPHTSRGRFVRIQCEGRAILHIERVHVYVAKPPAATPNDPVVRRQLFRQKLQRAAFCASVLATTASPVAESNRVAVKAEPTPKRRLSTLSARTSRRRGSSVIAKGPQNEVDLASFFDPERAEKRRVSRLYARFKSLLDARAKYIAPEVETDEEVNEENS